MSTDDQIRNALNEAVEPVPPPEGLADSIIASSVAGSAAVVGGSSLFSLPVIIGGAVLLGTILGAALGLFTSDSAAAVPAEGLEAAPVFACPGDGEVGRLHRGDRVLITGQSGDWVAVRNVRGWNETVFVHSDYITADADLSGLPEQDCDESGVLSVAGVSTTTTAPDTTTSTVPGDTTTTVVVETTTTTVPPTTTTTAPDTTAPSINNAKATPTEIWEENGLGISCPANTPRETVVSATVTDVVGVVKVTASWSDPDGLRTVTMSKSGSLYSTTVGPYEAGDWENPSTVPYDNNVPVTIAATDAAGNKSSVNVNLKVWEIGACFI